MEYRIQEGDPLLRLQCSIMFVKNYLARALCRPLGFASGFISN